jgi:hypothetical protein
MEPEMGVAITVIIAVILIAIIVKLRRQETTSNNRPSPTGRHEMAKTGSQFHAVSLQFPDSACEAAKAMAGKRILSSSAPRIPLPECDLPECKCHFAHHKDRRRGEDRRGQVRQDVFGTTGRYAGKERRYRGDRRDSDDPEDFFS